MGEVVRLYPELEPCDFKLCEFCGALIMTQHVVVRTPLGQRYFCKLYSDEKPEKSCYLRWKHAHGHA